MALGNPAGIVSVPLGLAAENHLLLKWTHQPATISTLHSPIADLEDPFATAI
jgi:hypothetical protein